MRRIMADYKRTVLILSLLLLILFVIHNGDYIFSKAGKFHHFVDRPSVEDIRMIKDLIHYDRSTPLIWIGGVPRSGTTLCRAMMDAHPDVRCGQETHVIPRVLGQHMKWYSRKSERKRFDAAGVSIPVVNQALGAYILNIIVGHGAPAKRYCNKDPLTLAHMRKLNDIFPKSKFILMIRDGRSVAYSLIHRHVKITGWNETIEGALIGWNNTIGRMWNECSHLKENCLPVWYEKLVLDPEKESRRMLEFLDLEWNEAVLHHEEFIGKEVLLSQREPSTNQVIAKINQDALSKWVNKIPEYLKRKMDEIAPMLRKLGYDPSANPPDYKKMKTVKLRSPGH